MIVMRGHIPSGAITRDDRPEAVAKKCLVDFCNAAMEMLDLPELVADAPAKPQSSVDNRRLLFLSRRLTCSRRTLRHSCPTSNQDMSCREDLQMFEDKFRLLSLLRHHLLQHTKLCFLLLHPCSLL